MNVALWLWALWALCGVGLYFVLHKAHHQDTGLAVIWCLGMPWAFAGTAGAFTTVVLLITGRL